MLNCVKSIKRLPRRAPMQVVSSAAAKGNGTKASSASLNSRRYKRKKGEQIVMGRHSTTITPTTIYPSQSPCRKRKRDHSPTAEIEVDVSAPEPPSKKALRKVKKGKSAPTSTEIKVKVDRADASPNYESNEDLKARAAPPTRSEYGIWIGNLPWTATKPELRTFLTRDTEITGDMITRLHMPPPSRSALASSRQTIKLHNQGFAYVDFSTEAALVKALALGEKLLTGRRVLIKDSKSFEGRPEKTKEEGASSANLGKPPSKRIFVGNLGFDTTNEMLQDHLARCGEVLDVFLATFEDTGKCKGYGWVEFAELGAGEAAVRGWVNFEQDGDGEDEDDEIAQALADQVKPKKKPRMRKWWVNRLGGRPLRMEFAEGKDVRYKKRYGKERTAREEGKTDTIVDPPPTAEAAVESTPATATNGKKQYSARKPSRKVDPRTIKPGAALAAAPRLTGGIVESKGKKTNFA